MQHYKVDQPALLSEFRTDLPHQYGIEDAPSGANAPSSWSNERQLYSHASLA